MIYSIRAGLIYPQDIFNSNEKFSSHQNVVKFIYKGVQKMKMRMIPIILAINIISIPEILFSFDIPGFKTWRGKVIDADTLKPIDGAVVWIKWSRDIPGIGSSTSRLARVEEVLTDANGEWKIWGPDKPGFIRTIITLGFFWSEFSGMGVYKPGYYPMNSKLGIEDFKAWPYVNKDKNLEGIVLALCNNKDSFNLWKKAQEEHSLYHCLWFIPVKNPRDKLGNLDFDFKKTTGAIPLYSFNERIDYEVIAIKQAKTSEEKYGAWSLGGNGIVTDWGQPLLRDALKVRPR
jgi:hypothetical protein